MTAPDLPLFVTPPALLAGGLLDLLQAEGVLLSLKEVDSGRYRWANAAFLGWLGAEASRVPGATDLELLPQAEANALQAADARALAAEQPVVQAWRLGGLAELAGQTGVELEGQHRLDPAFADQLVAQAGDAAAGDAELLACRGMLLLRGGDPLGREREGVMIVEGDAWGRGDGDSGRGLKRVRRHFPRRRRLAPRLLRRRSAVVLRCLAAAGNRQRQNQ